MTMAEEATAAAQSYRERIVKAGATSGEALAMMIAYYDGYVQCAVEVIAQKVTSFRCDVGSPSGEHCIFPKDHRHAHESTEGKNWISPFTPGK